MTKQKKTKPLNKQFTLLSMITHWTFLIITVTIIMTFTTSSKDGNRTKFAREISIQMLSFVFGALSQSILSKKSDSTEKKDTDT